MFILNIFLYKPIRKVLAERKAEIDGAREKSASIDKEVQEKQALYESHLGEIKAGATDERSGIRKEAQLEEAAILDKARKDAADTLSAIKSKIAKESADARQLLKEQALSLSSEICEKVLGRSI